MIGILLLAAGGGIALYAMSKKDSTPEAKREPLTSVVGPAAAMPIDSRDPSTVARETDAYYFVPAPAKVTPVYSAPAPAASSLAKPSLTMSSPVASKSFAKPAPVMSAPVYFKTATKV